MIKRLETTNKDLTEVELVGSDVLGCQEGVSGEVELTKLALIDGE